MPTRSPKVYACDAETDPFQSGRIPKPFIWGLYDGKQFQTFDSTEDFIAYIKPKRIILYAHNGGRFDFMYLLNGLGETKAQVINGRIVSMFIGKCELRDSFAIIPVALKEFGAKREIDFWKLEAEYRDGYRDEILEYLFMDCKVLWDGVTAYRRMAGKRTTIASNALAFAKKLGIDPGKSNHRFDEKYRAFYFGGRCECFIGGMHENIRLLDIHSAYPFAMLHDHATGTNFKRTGNINKLTTEQIQRAFIRLRCFSKGAFPIRTKDGLSFPHEYREYHVTGWEYLTAKEFNLIQAEEILSVRYTHDTINFRSYVNHWYKLKSATDKETDSVTYTIAKIMLNSLYGKLAQNITRYYDYRYVPAGTSICAFDPHPKNPDKCAICDQDMRVHGWTKNREYEDHEIHRRPSLWRYKMNYGEEWKGKGIYNNVATGASITGFTRAHVLRAMHTIGIEHIIYVDTDGIVVAPGGDLRAIPLTDDVGDWELEDTAPVGYFAGKKLYGIQMSRVDKKTGKQKVKIASKGSKLAYEDIKRIVAGETILWKNPAPTFAIDGTATFVHREIRATAPIPVPALTAEKD